MIGQLIMPVPQHMGLDTHLVGAHIRRAQGIGEYGGFEQVVAIQGIPGLLLDQAGIGAGGQIARMGHLQERGQVLLHTDPGAAIEVVLCQMGLIALQNLICQQPACWQYIHIDGTDRILDRCQQRWYLPIGLCCVDHVCRIVIDYKGQSAHITRRHL